MIDNDDNYDNYDNYDVIDNRNPEPRRNIIQYIYNDGDSDGDGDEYDLPAQG
jgi:hypothetical protein